jgi:hypothetical protein
VPRRLAGCRKNERTFTAWGRYLSKISRVWRRSAALMLPPGEWARERCAPAQHSPRHSTLREPFPGSAASAFRSVLRRVSLRPSLRPMLRPGGPCSSLLVSALRAVSRGPQLSIAVVVCVSVPKKIHNIPTCNESNQNRKRNRMRGQRAEMPQIDSFYFIIVIRYRNMCYRMSRRNT